MITPSKTSFISKIPAATVFALACLVYANSIGNGFALDDLIHITQNVDIRTLDGTFAALLRPMFPGNLFRPLVTLSYGLTYKFYALDPLPYHFINVVLHGLVSVLIVELLSKIVSRQVAFLSGVIFALHPVHTEVVANVTGRAELFAALFSLITLNIFASTWRFKNLQLVGLLVFSFLACASKESAVTLPILAILVLFWKRDITTPQSNFLLSGIIVGVLAYLTLRIYVLGLSLGEPSFLDNVLGKLSAPERFINALVLLGQYISLGIVPLILNADYSYGVITPVLDWFRLEVIASVLLCGTLLFLSFHGFRSRKSYSFFGFWFFISFLVTSNLFFPVGTIFGERLLYLPSVGLSALIAVGISELKTEFLKKAFMAGYLCFFIAWTHARNLVWENSESLYKAQIEISPQSARTQYNFGVLLLTQGDFDGAEKHFNKALSIYPAYEEAAFGLGEVAAVRGQTEEAIKWYKKSLVLNSEYTPSIIKLREIYHSLGDLNSEKSLQKW